MEKILKAPQEINRENFLWFSKEEAMISITPSVLLLMFFGDQPLAWLIGLFFTAVIGFYLSSTSSFKAEKYVSHFVYYHFGYNPKKNSVIFRDKTLINSSYKYIYG